MATFLLSRRAEADLVEIGTYTLGEWGREQALRYVDELENACQRLADHPMTGRLCNQLQTGLRRMEQGRHVIFYRPHQAGVFISRILHERMLPKNRDLVEDD